jgi:hypothetical protein
VNFDWTERPGKEISPSGPEILVQLQWTAAYECKGVTEVRAVQSISDISVNGSELYVSYVQAVRLSVPVAVITPRAAWRRGGGATLRGSAITGTLKSHVTISYIPNNIPTSYEVKNTMLELLDFYSDICNDRGNSHVKIKMNL